MKTPPATETLLSERHWRSRPLRNPQVRARRDEDGELQLRLVRHQNWRTRLLSLFYFPAPERPLVLDGQGEAVWTLCDGQRTVREVVAAVEARFPDDDDLEARTVAFLRVLMERGLLGMLVPEEDDD